MTPEEQDESMYQEMQAIPLQMNHVDCPVGELICDLINTGTALPWAVRYAQAGDPLPALWTACRDPDRMVMLVRRVFDRSFADRVWAAKHLASYRMHTRAEVAAQCDAIRALVPTVTLAQVLESK